MVEVTYKYYIKKIYRIMLMMQLETRREELK
jgi:hypothetical protein